MNTNARQILDDILDQKRKETDESLKPEEYFELFCAEQILKDYDLSYDDVNSGIVDGEHDGGIDSIYTFVNGDLVHEDFSIKPYKKNINFEVHIIQSKSRNGYSESAINSVMSTIKHLMKLDADYMALDQYNGDVKSAFDLFRDAYRALASKYPDLNIYFHFAAKNADSEIHPNLKIKASELKNVANSLFADAKVEFNFLGAAELLSLARQRPKTTFNLSVSKALSADSGYVVLCNLSDFNSFLRDENDDVRVDIFDANVRDFQGSTEVNNEIAETLRSEKEVDFWWMNNGITILSSKATLIGDTVVIENPQIVNGLQTSSQIANFFNIEPETENRKVMVKIISSEVEETRDKVIKATNSQNPVPPASLRATDKVQRDIEHVLKINGLYYDRRKNFYKNEGRPATKIISIPLMAQAVMSLVRAEPDNARARPSSLIKNDEVYSALFSAKAPVGLYLNAAILIRRIEIFLKTDYDLTARDRNNLRFYVLYWLVAKKVFSTKPSAEKVSKIDCKNVKDSDIDEAFKKVWRHYQKLGATDQAAKGPELRNNLRISLQKKFELNTKKATTEKKTKK